MSAKEMVMGALLGDAISLGPHWVYDQEEIVAKMRRPVVFHDPLTAYHPGKHAGDLTHYGDQLLVLLRDLSQSGGYSLEDYSLAWRRYWEDPETVSYRDGATRQTLANLEKGISPRKAGAVSHDLGGASIVVPLFLQDWENDEALLDACRELTAFTHNEPDVIAAAEFFTKMCLAINRGIGVKESLEQVAATLSPGNLRAWFLAAEQSAASSDADAVAIKAHGLSCNIDGGFAGVCHLLLRYPEDPFTAMVENAAAGGDNAARGLLLGMVYGAADLLDELPDDWRNSLHARSLVEAFG